VTEEQRTPAERVEEQTEAAQKAAARRDRDAERTQELKSQADAGGPMPQRETRDGGTRYAYDRLVGDEAFAITGYPAHVVIGALHDSSDAYLTREEATAKVEEWLQREDTTGVV
jgi:hypothetical protein